ncbi:MAG: o-succinylbenzoate synthase, partial [Coriobacteriaceae bacterium]|nr:o-succinylbenzoate synthase [Coriobacteriaceae bacterium]
IHEVRLYRIRQQLKTPITTAKTTLRFRESIIVEVIDWAGRSGLGECVAFPTDWYLPETLEQDEAVLKNYLVPLVLDQVYLHPREVSLCFDECDGAAAYPLAKAALEPAFWDLYGKIVEKPLWQLLNEEIKSDAVSSLAFVAPKKESLDDDGGSAEKVAVRAGLVLGILPVEKTLEAVQNAVDEGYSRVKLKVKPGDDLVRVTAVREAFPAITLMLDANQSYVEQEFATLRAFDELDICCIEEPLDPGRSPKVGPTGLFARLARLQKNMKTPICLDESVVNALDLNQALSFPGLRSYALKIAKLGGVTPALAMYKHLQIHKAQVWMGGMYDTGVSKYLHAAFETLPDITPEGDLSSSSNYFEHDLCDPPFEVKEGMVVLNTEGHEKGLGCVLNYETLNKILIDHRSYAR